MKEEIVKAPSAQAKGLSVEIDREEFALALKTWRLRTGATQGQAAKKFGVSRFTIIKAEQAKSVSWETAYRIFARLSQELRKEGEQ